MPGPNGEAGQGQTMPKIDRQPVMMGVEIERRPVGDQVWLIVRFVTAQGENEFWFTPEAGQAFGRTVMQAASGLIIAGPGEVPG